jgi:RND family efflux transporter MFP subunit
MMASNLATRMVACLFALVAPTVCFVASCREQSKSVQPAGVQQAPVEVRVAPVQRRSVQRGIDVTGTLFGEDEVRISAKVAGRIVATQKDIGDRVAAGELVAQVDRTDFELTRLQREAAVSEALSRLGLDDMPGADFDLSTLPAVRRAQAEESNAKSRLERGRQLFQNDPPLISEQEFADLQTALEVASRNVSVEMLAGKALLSMARSRAADLAVAEQALRDTEIRAPDRGADTGGYAVAQRLVSVGEWVSAGQTVFALVDADPIKFRAEIPERYASALQVGQRVSVNVEAYPESFAGVVRRQSPSVDAASRTFVIEAEIPNVDGRLKPGNFARGRIDTIIEPNVAFVPSAAIVSFAGIKRVFTVNNGKASEHRIQTGLEIDGAIEVVGATLPADVEVIIEGATKVSNGAAVHVLSPKSDGGSGGSASAS